MAGSPGDLPTLQGRLLGELPGSGGGRGFGRRGGDTHDEPLRTEPWVLAALLGGVSFSLDYLLYTRRRLDAVLDREFLAYVALLVAATLFVWTILVFEGDYTGSTPQALRESAFAVTSVVTTTGFVTADFDLWDTGAKISLVVLMLVGGWAGSTAGGIKAIRILIVLRTVFEDVFRMVHPRTVTPLRVGRSRTARGRQGSGPRPVRGMDLGFALATLLLGIQRDLDPFSAATAVAATLNAIGPGLGQVEASESYEAINAFGRGVLTLLMLLGRLEIFTVLALVSPAFWRK